MLWLNHKFNLTRPYRGNTPLHEAAEKNQSSVAEILLCAGAAANAANFGYYHQLHDSCGGIVFECDPPQVHALQWLHPPALGCMSPEQTSHRTSDWRWRSS
jgi:hypothetical protein